MSTGSGRSRELNHASRFVVLADDEGVTNEVDGTVTGSYREHPGAEALGSKSNGTSLGSSKSGSVVSKVVTKSAATVTSNPGKKSKVFKVLISTVPIVNVVPLVENVEAEVVENMVDKVSGSHAAISINESGYEGQGHSGGKVVKARENLLRSTKENAK
ncbi:hypothetical protein V6N13_124207 [Hibiscus sabdariffa]|uniref:Uncharacterized protein n=1 Tax=Hibiscus sabdariffa TaxID=183260 RepID=A0ABR2S0Q1_9ROSI